MRTMLAVIASVLVVSPLAAQRFSRDDRPPRPGPSLTVVGGAAPYDLAGTGTAGFGAVRVEFPVSRLLLVEPGLSVLHYRNQLGASITYLLPEVSLQIEAPLTAIRPYAGVGIGYSEYLSGRGQSLFTMHAAAGLRVPVGGGWGLRGEVRARTIDPFAGETFEFGFGVSRVLRQR